MVEFSLPGMLLAIDGYEANSEVRVGIGRYAFELINHIAKRQVQHHAPFDEVRVYVPEQVRPHMPKETPSWCYRAVFPKNLWTFIGLPAALTLDRPRPDVVFSPTHYIPRFVGIPRVMAIMDISYLSYQELFRPQDLHKLINWTAYSVRHAAKIITISEFSKRAIMEAYGVSEEQVEVVYPGLTMTKISNIKYQISNIHSKYKIGKNYILSVGTLQPRKNYVRLIEAFSRSLNILVSQYPDISLVIVGKKGWLYKEILASPAKFGVADRVKFLDFVPDEDLPLLYQNALCFALPSLYEGFGLPVLEAMAQGIPVVVSKTSSFPEIAAEAGIYVDPENVESIQEGLVKALAERDRPEGKRRIELGKKRAKEFSWDKAARQLLEVLGDVARRGR